MEATKEKTTETQLPKIYVFKNGSLGSSDGVYFAVAEDGECLASHVSSCDSWAMHDMGVDENGWKRDIYAKHYPNGFDVEFVESDQMESHPGLLAAIEKNKQLKAEDDAAIAKADGK